MRTLLSALHDHARSDPYAVAFLVRQDADWKSLTWLTLEKQVHYWAATFLRHGLKQGGAVFIVLKHCSDLYPAFLGAMRAGLIPSFLPYPTPKQDPELYWKGHESLFRTVEPGCILTYAENLDRIRVALRSMNCLLLDVADWAPTDERVSTSTLPQLSQIEAPDAVALLQHSSGTTGLKKGVALSYGQIGMQLDAYAKAIKASKQDCIVSWLPVYHDMGLITSFLLPLTVGCMVVSIDAFDWLVKPHMLFGLIEEHRATLCWLPNFAFNHLIRTRSRNRAYDLSSLRGLINCSEPCKAETFERFQEAFKADRLPQFALQTCYAMAEAVFAVTQTCLSSSPACITLDQSALAERGSVVEVPADHPRAARFLSCGHAVDGVDLRIVAEGGGDVGEIQLSGEFIFEQYHRNAKDSADAFVDGWYRTGDIGFTVQGELYVCGRIKELLIVHGRNYYANDVEMIVNQIDGIKPGRAVVFGIHDPLTASEEAILLAEIDPRFRGDAVELGKSVRVAVFDHLELALKKVLILPPGALVKTTSGKISRKENMRRYRNGQLTLTEVA